MRDAPLQAISSRVKTQISPLNNVTPKMELLEDGFLEGNENMNLVSRIDSYLKLNQAKDMSLKLSHQEIEHRIVTKGEMKISMTKMDNVSKVVERVEEL